jgi:hypothetical protein
MIGHHFSISAFCKVASASGRLLVGRKNLLAEIGETRAQAWIVFAGDLRHLLNLSPARLSDGVTPVPLTLLKIGVYLHSLMDRVSHAPAPSHHLCRKEFLGLRLRQARCQLRCIVAQKTIERGDILMDPGECEIGTMVDQVSPRLLTWK